MIQRVNVRVGAMLLLAGCGSCMSDINELPAAGTVALEESGEDAGDRVFAAHGEGVCAVGTDGGQVVVFVAGAHHRAAEGDADQVAGGEIAPGAG